MANGEAWLSGPQAAKLLGLQLHTLHALIDRGELAADIVPPGNRSTGRRRAIRIRREAIHDYLQRSRVKPGELRHLHPNSSWERSGSPLMDHSHAGTELNPSDQGQA